jgi:hypothetical protein
MSGIKKHLFASMKIAATFRSYIDKIPAFMPKLPPFTQITA